LASALSFVALAEAAEITIGQTVVLEGRIEPGDYDKLRDSLLVERNYNVSLPACVEAYLDGCPDEIYLASPGGDVAEAMKIGRLVRALGWAAIAPAKWGNSKDGVDLKQAEITRRNLEDPKTNYMCTSACFLVLLRGIFKNTDVFPFAPVIGIHQPYLSTEQLKELTGGQAIATANLTRAIVEKYFKEMDVPTKYIDQMFSVPKDQILWISEDDFDADFRGFIPSLRDWVDAKCKLTDVETVALDAIRKKPSDKRTKAESDVEERLAKKQLDCEHQAKFELRKDAWQRWRKETLRNIADICMARTKSSPSELATALSAAVPNQRSATVALNLAQTAALCRNYQAREDAIRTLANRGDAKAERILGNLYFIGGSTIARDRVEGMAWYGRAGAHGDLFAQKFHRDFADKVVDPNHIWTNQENRGIGLWIFRNCPALC